MLDGFRVEGSWPSPIALMRGWGRAVARPWNDEGLDAFLRLERGRAEFLRAASEAVAELSGGGVFSPAVFPSAGGIWERAGYEEVGQLEVMEMQLGSLIAQPDHDPTIQPEPNWEQILEVDRAAFRGFWRMSVHGLREALTSTDRSTVLVAQGTDGDLVGYAIVGSQWRIAYLQRVAVRPSSSGKGLGRDLVRGAMQWARGVDARTFVLNVRPENHKAKRLYQREGLIPTGTKLHILRYGTSTLLN